MHELISALSRGALALLCCPVYALYLYRFSAPPRRSPKNALLLAFGLLLPLQLLRLYAVPQGSTAAAAALFALCIAVCAAACLLLTRSFGRALLCASLLWTLDALARWVCVLAAGVLGERLAPVGEWLLVFSENLPAFLFVPLETMLLTVASDLFARFSDRRITDTRVNVYLLTVSTGLFGLDLLLANVFSRAPSALPTLSLLLYLLLLVGSGIYLFYALKKTARTAALDAALTLLNEQRRMETARHAALDRQLSQMNAVRDEYLAMLRQLSAQNAAGDTDGMRALLASAGEQVEKTRPVHTGCGIVDAVLYAKTAEAAARGVTIQTSLLWPNTLPVSDADLMRLFVNLLDNAIDYAAALPADRDRTVTVESTFRGNLLAFSFTNAFLGNMPPRLPSAHAAPEGLHGHGLAIVREIAERSGGNLVVFLSGGRVTFRVLLGSAN